MDRTLSKVSAKLSPSHIRPNEKPNYSPLHI